MDSNLSARILAEVRSEREKQSRDVVTAARQMATKDLKQDALKDIGRLALWSLGVGTAARGGYGLYNVLRRNLAKRKPSAQLAPMPIPVAPEEEEEEPQVPDMLKTSSWLSDMVEGNLATTKEGLPWYRPAKLMGGLAAGYGGWKLVDTILDKRRRQEVEGELEDERNKFRQALLSQYDQPVPEAKVAEDSPLVKAAEDLDKLFDAVMEKRATMGQTGGQMAGLYGMYAAPAALLAGYAAWSAAKKRRRKNILAKAVAKRKQRRQAMRPQEIFAMPVPVEQEEQV